MKKLIAFLISFSIILGMTHSFANEVLVEPNESAQILVQLKILDNKFLLNPNKVINNTEAEKIISFLRTGDTQIPSGKDENNASVRDVVESLLGVLGYDVILKQQGYQYALNRSGLAMKLMEFFNKKTINYNDFAKIVFVALHTNLIEQKYYGSAQVTFNNKSSEPLLNKRFGIYLVEGIMTDNGITALSSATATKKNRIKIDDVECSLLDTGFSKYLGRFVNAYAKLSNDSEWIVGYISAKKNQEIVISAEDIVDFRNQTYIVKDDNGKEKAYTMFNGFNIVYNEMYTTNFDKEHLIPTNGNVTLVDNNRDGLYDLSFVRKYENILIESVDTENSVLNGKTNKNGNVVTTSIDLSETINVDIVDENNNNIEMIDINKYDIASVMRPDSVADYTKIIISRKKVLGILNEISDETLMIDKESYELATDMIQERINIGANVEIYLSIHNKVLYIKSDPDDGYRYAYMIKKAIEKGLDAPLQIKLLDVMGKVKIFSCDKGIIIDDSQFISGAENQSKLLDDIITQVATKDANGNLLTGLVIRYKLSKDGFIKYIDTVANTKEGEITRQLNYSDTYNKSLLYKTASNSIASEEGPKAVFDSKTVCFWVPSPANDTGDDLNYLVSSKEQIRSDQSLKKGLETYSLSSASSMYQQLLVLYNEEKSISNLSLITKVTRALNENGEMVTKVYTLDNDINAIYYLTDEDIIKNKILKLEVGDIVRFTFDNANDLKSFEINYSYSENKLNNAVGYLVDDYRVAFGYVIDKSDQMIALYEQSALNSVNYPFNALNFYEFNKFNIYKISRSGGTITIEGATGDEMKAYKYSGNDCSRIAVISKKGAPISIIIYER